MRVDNALSIHTRPHGIVAPHESLDETSLQRIAFNGAQHIKEVVVMPDGKCLEAALQQMAAGVVGQAVAADAGVLQPVHPTAEVAIVAGPDDEVKVIGHEASGEQAHGHFEAGRALSRVYTTAWTFGPNRACRTSSSRMPSQAAVDSKQDPLGAPTLGA